MCCSLFLKSYAKRDIDHAFKTKTKPKRANLTKEKGSVSLHCLKSIYVHIGHTEGVVSVL